ncbi:MAG: hypothetical protein MR630_06275 [Selenomonas sp.]|uniref:hypothetical protein n=1 Tax=Selenomonas sp. TaxID=2053611 RepID=UPI0025CC45D4|nr:hypothetical protein [Selenomonas sp.]MCI6232198.1 hypothetical protein [Selenomonas sp.]
MRRIFCGLSCGLAIVACCAVFFLTGGTVAAHAAHSGHDAQGVVRAEDFSSHGIAIGQAATEEQLSKAFGKLLYDDTLARWGIPLKKYTFKKGITVYALQKTGQVAEIVLEKDAATGRDGIRYGATSYYIQHVYGKAQRENIEGAACFVYRLAAAAHDAAHPHDAVDASAATTAHDAAAATALGVFAADARLVATVDHDDGSLTALRLTLLPLTEGEADAWAEAHPEALGDALTTDVLKKDMKLDTSALQEAPAPKLEGLTN